MIRSHSIFAFAALAPTALQAEPNETNVTYPWMLLVC